MRYQPVRIALTLALAGSLMFGALAGYSRLLFSLALVLVIVLGLVYWMVSHPAELLLAHEESLRKGEQEIRKAGRTGKPNLVLNAIIAGAVSIASMIGTFSFVEMEAPDRPLLALAYSTFGPKGLAAMAALGGAFALALALEIAIGVYWSKRQA